MKKPKQYKKGQYQWAHCTPAFKVEGESLPKAVYLHCEEMTAKDCRKLAKWLNLAARWMEQK